MLSEFLLFEIMVLLFCLGHIAIRVFTVSFALVALVLKLVAPFN